MNGIACGTFDTDSFRASIPNHEALDAIVGRIPLGRIGGPEEVVGTALYLVTDASSYLTGQLITLDGGIWFMATNRRPRPLGHHAAMEYTSSSCYSPGPSNR